MNSEREGSMRGTRISSGSKFEEVAGYSRVAVVPDNGGDWVFVSGTTGFDYALMTISTKWCAFGSIWRERRISKR
jgi:enamine deaminase RidA (YjgF/YER057c/UK114 family)